MKRKILVFSNKQLRIYLFEAGVMLLIILFFSGCLLTKTRRFGKLPEGSQLKYIKQLPNYRDGKLQNEVLAPVATEGVSTFEILWGFSKPGKNKYPIDQIPVQRTDLNMLGRRQEIFLWMGHSSSFLQASGKRILIDPVLSKSASPFSFDEIITSPIYADDLLKEKEMHQLIYLWLAALPGAATAFAFHPRGRRTNWASLRTLYRHSFTPSQSLRARLARFISLSATNVLSQRL
jgi:hypothetical protein